MHVYVCIYILLYIDIYTSAVCFWWNVSNMWAARVRSRFQEGFQEVVLLSSRMQTLRCLYFCGVSVLGCLLFLVLVLSTWSVCSFLFFSCLWLHVTEPAYSATRLWKNSTYTTPLAPHDRSVSFYRNTVLIVKRKSPLEARKGSLHASYLFTCSM